ncbi:MAG: signal peptidase I [Gemmatimonadota bacterium]|nr:signal peptidase I [Gemmatimonadota bacterium]MDH5803541.1 signal peptidase I [Gemmatimonadota bacterium]
MGSKKKNKNGADSKAEEKKSPVEVKAPETAKEWAVGWIKTIVIAVLIFFVLRTSLIGAFHITSGSMEPTLLVGDVLFVNKTIYGSRLPLLPGRLPAFRDPRRGDIVVFESVETKNLNVVKRLVGVPGDTIEMRDNAVYVNGDPLDEPYAIFLEDPRDPMNENMARWQTPYLVETEGDREMPTQKNWGPLVVPPDSFLAMGDNRDSSYDGRWWGFLGKDRIMGRAVIIYYSFDKNGILPLPFFTAIRWRRLFSFIR